jgi:serine protease AprX
MRKIITLLFVIVLVIPASILTINASAASGSQSAPLIDPQVQNALVSMQPGDMLTVIVTLREQADLTRVKGVDFAARQQGVIQALQATANSSQGRLVGWLNSYRTEGLVNNFQSLWIFNGLSVTAEKSIIRQLELDPEIQTIMPDNRQIVPDYAPAEANITQISAPSLWDLGITGQGVVVANMDSGVDISHPDLASRWRGGSDSWYDPYGQHLTTPTDIMGHGTWTMGIMVGGDAGGTTVGAAPTAQWIAVKIFNDSGVSTSTAIHLGYQWLLDPDANPATADAPQVVNNSWGFGSPGCYLDFEMDLESLRAAGILPVFSAGNGGPNAATSYSPANNPAAFAVGAVDPSDQIASFSSRGPSTCGGSAGPFPELVAPGVNIRTTDLLGGYYLDSGTSFAAPHVAGSLALLISAFPGLSPADQEAALENTAHDLGAVGPDDTSGYGRVDVLSAYNWLAAGNHAAPTLTPAPTSTPLPTATPIPTPTPTAAPTPVPTTIHVGDLDGASTRLSKSWTATVTILVHNSNEQPVANAVVSGKWSKGASGTASCTTDTSGQCVVSKTGNKNTTTSVTFSITGVTYPTLSYQASSNHDPDGDSNGTTIMIVR